MGVMMFARIEVRRRIFNGSLRSGSKPFTQKLLSILAALTCLWVVAGCVTKLSHSYDGSTYTALTDLNVKAETLFASLSGSQTASSFQTHKETYDQLIGGFSAVRMTTAVREIPPSSQRLLSASQMKAVCGDDR